MKNEQDSLDKTKYFPTTHQKILSRNRKKDNNSKESMHNWRITINLELYIEP